MLRLFTLKKTTLQRFDLVCGLIYLAIGIFYPFHTRFGGWQDIWLASGVSSLIAAWVGGTHVMVRKVAEIVKVRLLVATLR